MKKLIKKIPLVQYLIPLWRFFFTAPFVDSKSYWIDRYKRGGSSGSGSYNDLAEFKAEIINSFVLDNKIQTIIDLGSGDGNQLQYFRFPSYLGFEISQVAIEKCQNKFKDDASKKFLHMDELSSQRADLSLSLDVIYHLIEDDVYHQYMNQLFDVADHYVIIYAVDCEDRGDYNPHMKTRKFTSWILENKPNFKLIKHIPNRYPYSKGQEENSSLSEFFIYMRIPQ